MYFSENNEDIVFINHYSGLLEVEGKGVLVKEDTEMDPPFEEDRKEEYDTLSITEGIIGIEEGFLEFFYPMDCLILSRTVTFAKTSPELDKKLKRHKVLIRGEYDTFAESFAEEKGLKFLHCDIPLAVRNDERHHETEYLTLRFHEKGAPDIHHNIFSPGSSAGNYGGGEFVSKLPKNFYVGCTMEKFAANFPEDAHDQLMSNEMLKRFLKAANKRLKKG